MRVRMSVPVIMAVIVIVIVVVVVVMSFSPAATQRCHQEPYSDHHDHRA
jgi:uncharacterized membrane protein